MEQLNLKNKNKAFSTIELMIAMAIMVLVLTAVVMTSFGSQSFLIGSQTNAEAMKHAQALEEEQQALARKDFNLVNSKEEVEDGIFKKSVQVKLLDDFLTKEVTTIVRWTNERKIEQSVELTTLITNFDNAIGGNTCASNLTGDWSQPRITETYDFSSGTYLTDIDAYHGKLYATAGKTSTKTDPTFFVFKINDDNISYQGGVDTSGATVSSGGPNALVVAKNYAYLANGYGADFNACTPEGPNCSQLQVINLSNNNPSILKNYKLSNILTAIGGAGNSIFYKNGYVYLGLTSTGNSESEFNIIDVHTPNSPINLGPGIDIGNNAINSILVKGKYAYLATADSAEKLKVVDISNPSSPKKVSGFVGQGVYGKSIFGVGDSIYFGTTKNLNPASYYVLNAVKPENIEVVPLIEKSFSSSINGIIVRDTLAFILTKNTLEIINAKDASSVASIPLSGNTNTFEPSFDCEGNYLYITSGNKIDVITSTQTP
jgi:type II secretory pathway pseudopilin PulG